MSYPLYTASGSPRELGRQHGVQAQPKILAFLDYLSESLTLTRSQLAARAVRFESLFQQHCPQLLEEVAGLAEGAGIDYGEALAAQVRGELGQAGDGACTTFVIGPRGTTEGTILIGQTSDTPAEIEEFAYVLRLAPEGKPEILMWTFGGMLGYHGVNSAGVAHFANALGGGPAWKFALPHYPLKRMLLECRRLDDLLGLFQRVPVCSNGNYVVCAEGQLRDVELTSEGPFVISDSGRGFLAHANHYLCSPHACPANFEQSLPDSFPRQVRMETLLTERFGSLSVPELQRILSDHAGAPVGICRHPHSGYGDGILPNTGKTVAALIAEPAHGRLHIARGNPCQNPFQTYSLS
ncbi:MAG: C45 family autoproteolytic acyltransferase/hydrolase [Planctomycetales bacterium]